MNATMTTECPPWCAGDCVDQLGEVMHFSRPLVDTPHGYGQISECPGEPIHIYLSDAHLGGQTFTAVHAREYGEALIKLADELYRINAEAEA
ncbi:hypothetical protein GCM10022234_35950 [Aeromicrobium panaciterrae]|uniref:hypothetical protein n=1 Tax=Aeromicrobium panaciterrae TaxID=363861 RepID=UPI0031D7119B